MHEKRSMGIKSWLFGGQLTDPPLPIHRPGNCSPRTVVTTAPKWVDAPTYWTMGPSTSTVSSWSWRLHLQHCTHYSVRTFSWTIKWPPQNPDLTMDFSCRHRGQRKGRISSQFPPKYFKSCRAVLVNVLSQMWGEVEFRFDVCIVVNGVQIELYWIIIKLHNIV